ncbi:MAG: hypothetical protein LBS68_03245 [Puniceicoccales bacterium]|nr:hypothetical protein [Puniceicoccales bacterium]
MNIHGRSFLLPIREVNKNSQNISGNRNFYIAIKKLGDFPYATQKISKKIALFYLGNKI